MNSTFDIAEVEAAFDAFKEKADGGSAEHQEKLGIYYWLCFDTNNAEKYLELAAYGGSLSAAVMLSELYAHPPTEFDSVKKKTAKQKAIYWLEWAAERGDKHSVYALSQHYRDIPGKEKVAFEYCLRAAKMGLACAQNDVGACYEHGVGVARSIQQAFSWYMRAAEQGDATAMYNVGQYYRTGQAVEKDQEKAFAWYMKAAEQGIDDAQDELGVYYDEGEIIPRNPYEAYKWFRRGAISGSIYARYSLSKCYTDGIGVGIDYEKAFILCYELATMAEPFTYAVNKIGICFLNGEGVKQDVKQAILWFKKGANMGNPYSMLNLAEFYESGEDAERNPDIAKRLRAEAERILHDDE